MKEKKATIKKTVKTTKTVKKTAKATKKIAKPGTAKISPLSYIDSIDIPIQYKNIITEFYTTEKNRKQIAKKYDLDIKTVYNIIHHKDIEPIVADLQRLKIESLVEGALDTTDPATIPAIATIQQENGTRALTTAGANFLNNSAKTRIRVAQIIESGTTIEQSRTQTEARVISMNVTAPLKDIMSMSLSDVIEGDTLR